MAKESSMGMLLLGKPEKEEPEESDDGAVSAAEAALKAFKANDAVALSEALKLHYEFCSMPEYEDE